MHGARSLSNLISVWPQGGKPVYTSCCVHVDNVKRTSYILPREKLLNAQGEETDTPVSSCRAARACTEVWFLHQGGSRFFFKGLERDSRGVGGFEQVGEFQKIGWIGRIGVPR